MNKVLFYLIALLLLTSPSFSNNNNTEDFQHLQIICYFKENGTYRDNVDCLAFNKIESSTTSTPESSTTTLYYDEDYYSDEINDQILLPSVYSTHVQHTLGGTRLYVQYHNPMDTTHDNSNKILLELHIYYSNALSKAHCSDRNYKDYTSNDTTLVTRDVVDHGNDEDFYFTITSSGCYDVLVKDVKDDVIMQSLGPFFLHVQDPINLDHLIVSQWNTTIFMYPHHINGSISLQWQQVPYPHNYTSYDLQLWHHPTKNLSCRGDDDFHHDPEYQVFPHSGGVLVNETKFTFTALPTGWYCARITPVDNTRCRHHDCPVLYTHTKELIDVSNTSATDSVKSPTGDVVMPTIFVAVCAVLVVAAAIVGIVVRNHCNKPQLLASNQKTLQYDRVNTHDQVLTKSVTLLLVWTNEGSEGQYIERVMPPLKKCLQQYSHSVVYDYHDISSLPSQERQMLLQSPTSWVDKILQQAHIRILIINSNGAHALLKRTSTPPTLGALTQESSLFLYIMRRIKDSASLSSDYARVFQVRFPAISRSSECIEGVVPWVNYHLPDHFQELTAKLHLLSDASFNNLPTPSESQLSELKRVLSDIN